MFQTQLIQEHVFAKEHHDTNLIKWKLMFFGMTSCTRSRYSMSFEMNTQQDMDFQVAAIIFSCLDTD